MRFTARYLSIPLAIAAIAVLAAPARALDDEAVFAKNKLAEIFAGRPDLQAVFPDGKGNAAMVAAGMNTVEDWARRYGRKEFPNELAWFGRSAVAPKALIERKAAREPVAVDAAAFDFSGLSAHSVLVIDAATRKVLLSNRADEVRSIASITKLMTSTIVLDRRVSFAKRVAMSSVDEVGGATLSIRRGTTISVRDLLYAALVGSANNAASALSRSTGLNRTAFVAAMNAKAKTLGLASTSFADPTGINPDNVSTPREIAALSFEAFARPEIRSATTTAKYGMIVAKKAHNITNTNKLLVDEHNGLTVMGGKTGYLEESLWNLTTMLRTEKDPPVLVVVFGSASKADSFKDAEAAARWAWAHYRWQ